MFMCARVYLLASFKIRNEKIVISEKLLVKLLGVKESVIIYCLYFIPLIFICLIKVNIVLNISWIFFKSLTI